MTWPLAVVACMALAVIGVLLDRWLQTEKRSAEMALLPGRTTECVKGLEALRTEHERLSEKVTHLSNRVGRVP